MPEKQVFVFIYYIHVYLFYIIATFYFPTFKDIIKMAYNILLKIYFEEIIMIYKQVCLHLHLFFLIYFNKHFKYVIFFLVHILLILLFLYVMNLYITKYKMQLNMLNGA